MGAEASSSGETLIRTIFLFIYLLYQPTNPQIRQEQK